MTEEEFDALLRRVLIDVIHEDYADILEGDPQVPEHTPAYLKRRSQLFDYLGISIDFDANVEQAMDEQPPEE